MFDPWQNSDQGVYRECLSRGSLAGLAGIRFNCSLRLKLSAPICNRDPSRDLTSMTNEASPQPGPEGNCASLLPIDFLSVLLSGTEGAAVLFDDAGAEHLVYDDHDIDDVLVASQSPRVSLSTDEGECVGVALRHDSMDEAMTARERYGAPSFAMASDHRVTSVWLFEEACKAATASAAFQAPEVTTAVPMPGTAGHELVREIQGAGDYPRFSFQALVQKFSDVANDEEPAPFDASAPWQHHDAIVYGQFDSETLERELTIAFGRDQRTESWPNKTIPIGTFVNMLSMHKAGAKDGACFITGETVDKKRKRNSIKQMFVLGLDVDNGTSLETTMKKLRSRGQFAIVYTTHSHMKRVTEISQPKFYAWAKKNKIENASTSNVALLRSFLREVRSYTPEIAESVTGSTEQQTGEGIKIFVEHAPIPKFRIMFPLEAPYAFQQPGLSQQETVRSWGRKILGMAHDLQLSVDEACIDPSRLFYAPRHAEGRPYEVHIVSGALLDITSVSELRKGESFDHTDPFASAAAAMGAGEERNENYRFTKGGIDLWTWNRERGDGFELAQSIKDHVSPELIKFEKDDKLIVVCPFDDGHSNPGDDEDVACMVMNASSHDDAHPGFKFSCQHASCREFRKADFLCKAIELEYLPEEALTDDAYLSIEVEQRTQPLLNSGEVDRAIAGLSQQTGVDEIERVVEHLMRSDPSKLKLETSLKQIKRQTGSSLADLRASAQDCHRRLRKHLRNEGVQARTDDGLLKIYFNEEGFPGSLAAAKQELLLVNHGTPSHPNKTPRLFNFGGRVVRATRDADGALQLNPVTPVGMIHELNLATRWVVVQKAGENEVQPPEAIAKQILVDDEAKFPNLQRLVRTPFFDRNGRLVHTSGYHRESQCYYDPQQNFVLPHVPEHPTSEQALLAREFVMGNLFHDFPFDDGQGCGKSSRSHAFALLLLFFMRDMIQENTPGHFLTKPSPGTGASLLIDSVLLVATGQSGVPHVEKENSAEERKSMTSRLLSGATYFWLDNINDGIDSATYALALTTGVWADRILGSNEEATLPITWSWIFSGNNVDVSAEMARRLLPIRLDAKGNPTKRTNFKHADLTGWVRQNRGELVGACLTMIRYWINQGCPEMIDSKRRMASYESWGRKMGGLLQVLGVEGFLENLNLVRDRLQGEDEGFETLVACWLDLEHHGAPRPVEWRLNGRTHSLVDMMEENGIDLGLKAIDQAAKIKTLSNYLHKRSGRSVSIECEGGGTTDVILKERRNRLNVREFWLETPAFQNIQHSEPRGR